MTSNLQVWAGEDTTERVLRGHTARDKAGCVRSIANSMTSAETIAAWGAFLGRRRNPFRTAFPDDGVVSDSGDGYGNGADGEERDGQKLHL